MRTPQEHRSNVQEHRVEDDTQRAIVVRAHEAVGTLHAGVVPVHTGTGVYPKSSHSFLWHLSRWILAGSP